MSKHHDRRTWLAICSSLGAIGLGGFALAPPAMPFLFIPLAAFGLGGGFTLAMTLPLDNTRSVEEANVWNAFTLTVGYLIAAAGPILVGFLRDNTGSFQLPLWGLSGIAALMVLLTPFLAPHKILEEGENPGCTNHGVGKGIIKSLFRCQVLDLGGVWEIDRKEVLISYILSRETKKLQIRKHLTCAR